MCNLYLWRWCRINKSHWRSCHFINCTNCHDKFMESSTWFDNYYHMWYVGTVILFRYLVPILIFTISLWQRPLLVNTCAFVLHGYSVAMMKREKCRLNWNMWYQLSMLNVFIFPADGSTVETSQELYINLKQLVYTSIVVRKQESIRNCEKLERKKYWGKIKYP